MNRIRHSDFSKTLSFSFFAQVINFSVPIFSIPIIISKIGISGYGHYVFCLTLFSLIGVILDFDYNVSGLIYLAKFEEGINNILASKLLLFLLCFIIVSAVFFSTPNLRVAAIPAIISVLASTLNLTFFMVYMFKTGLVFVSSFISRIFLLLLTIFFIKSEFDALLTWSLSMLLYSSIIFFFSRNRFSVRKISYFGGISYIKSGFYSFSVQIAGFFAGNVHMVFANYLLNPQSFGQLALFDRIMRVGLSIFAVMNQNIFRRLESAREDLILYNTMFRKYLYLTLCFFSSGLILSPLFFSFLNLGSEFRNYNYSLLFFIMTIWCVTCIFNGFFGTNFFQFNEYYKSYLFTYMLSIIVSLGGMIILSKYYSLIGVALGILIGELIITPINYIFYLRWKK